MYQAPRGTTDILPEEQAYWQFIENRADDTCRLYGYQRIETPAFEDTRLFIRSVGEETDIVQKEMYTFQDRGGNSITLRPEGTAPVCRAYLEHGLNNLPQPVKLYYLATIFRYERPQAGRYRQHHQFGYEAIGEIDPALDAEVIDMAWHFFLSLGLTRLRLKINSIGCKGCRPQYLTKLREYYASCDRELCPDCKTRQERNPLRLLDCKKQSCQEVASAAPKSVDYLCPDCAAHFDRLKKYLSILDLPFQIDHCLVRGLDYYTKTVFEIQPEEEGGQSTLGGGGRYDNLIEELGGKPTPALGFATGIERIIVNLKKQNIIVPASPAPAVFVAFAGDEARDAAIKLSAALRARNIGVITAAGARSLKSQLRQSNSLGVRYTVLIGEQELKDGVVVLKDMTSSEQKIIPVARLPEELELNIHPLSQS